MEKINYDDGGCVITWSIENFMCIAYDIESPAFDIEANNKQNTRWKLQFCKFADHSILLRLCNENDFDISFLKISCSCFIKPSYIITRDVNKLLNFSDSLERRVRICYSGDIIPEKMTKNITIHCYFHIITDNNLLTNHYRFRSVVEAEQRRFKYTVPKTSTFKSDTKLKVNMPSPCNVHSPFEIMLCVPKEENSSYLYVEFGSIETNTVKVFSLLCKLTVFDGDSKCLFMAVHSNVFCKFIKKWRVPEHIIIKDLNQKSSKEFLTLHFELLVSEQKINTWMNEFATVTRLKTNMASETTEKEMANLRDDLLCLYVERKCPDVEICADGKKFPALKAILIARSPVFMAMFENSMQEKETNIVEISDLDSETVDRMLFFMYSEILQVRDWNKVIELYVASDKYQIMTLKDRCSSILKEQLSTKNICEALHLADMHCDPDFLNAVQDFIVSNDEEIFKSEEWKEFMNSNSKVACQTMHKAWLHRSE